MFDWVGKIEALVCQEIRWNISVYRIDVEILTTTRTMNEHLKNESELLHEELSYMLLLSNLSFVLK